MGFSMNLNLKPLFFGETEFLPVDCVIDTDEFGQVSVKGGISGRASLIVLKVKVSFTIPLECDRCLRGFSREYSFGFEHTLVTELNNEDNDELLVIEDYCLDLKTLLVTDIILELPVKSLCKHDCKGLCMKCGRNLNDGLCDCGKSGDIDPRLEILKQLIE